jgi:cell division protein FtsB
VAAPNERREGMAASTSTRRANPPLGTGIRWDRVGRIALLCVLGLVLYLYIGPTRTWISTWHESKQRTAELQRLTAENHRLKARRDELRKPATLEAEARAVGMVRGGEKGYVIRGLPDG